MNTKEEKILNSLTNLQKAAAPDFFYTRLIGRMQQEIAPKRKPVFLLQPAFVTAALTLVLIVNVFSILKFSKAPVQKATVQSAKPAALESFADAYNLNSASVYE